MNECGDKDREVIVKTDQENAIQFLVDDICTNRTGAKTIKEVSPKYSKGSNGVVERAVQSVEQCLRTLKSAVDEKFGVRINVRHPVITWLCDYTGYMMSRMEVGRDGKTPYERVKGKKAEVIGLEFGERFLWKHPPGKTMDKISARWSQGLFVGVKAKSNELIVIDGDTKQVKMVRTVRRVPEEQRWKAEYLEWVEAVPWNHGKEDKDADGILDEGGEIIGGEGGNPHTREKLDSFISDYNGMFGTNYSTKDTQSFYNYYQDIAKKVKERKVDILLVVNMFLTGFDSKTLNTLYVDKNLRYHGLVQAYSRTNRIINEVKSQGNIVVFRNLKARTDEAIALFSNVHAKEEIFVPPYDEYVKAFNETVMQLLALTPTVKSVKDLKDEEEELKFVKIFRELMRLQNILESFSEFDDGDLTLPAQRFADYRSAYLDLYDKVKTDNTKEKASILADVDFELELIHRDVINVQYILTLLARLYDAEEAQQANIRKLILDSVAGDIELRSKRELIQKFIDSNLPKLESSAEIPDSFEDFWEIERAAAFDQLVKEEQLDADKLKQVIDRYVYTGQEPLPDPDIVDLIKKPLGILERGPTRKRVLEKVVDYVETFIRGVAA
jgi:hypothetical protein